MHIESFDPQTASDAEWRALNAFDNRDQIELWPDDPPVSMTRTHRRALRPQFLVQEYWAAWNEGDTEIIGLADARYWLAEHNQHLVMFSLAVLPAFRCQGIGRQFLARIVESARRAGRTDLLDWAATGAAGATGFARAVGAKEGILSSTNQLDLRALDQGLMRAWLARAPERASGFELGYWDDGYPEEAYAEMVHVLDAMNDAPRDEIVEDEKWNEAQLRAYDTLIKSEGTVRWTAHVREKSSGRIAGYSEVFWNADRPTILYQGDTGVLPAYRNLGLGRWLKAAMILRILAERPDVRFVRTGNADSNAPMLGINYTMGFQPYRSWTGWQLTVDQAEQYLAARSVGREALPLRMAGG
ncbi:MAG: GNAT family N-acetyltransferase [Anaerolineae bacterium]|nr:GNAT family N-acetyltransferase [Anaerolineae bacterium]